MLLLETFIEYNQDESNFLTGNENRGPIYFSFIQEIVFLLINIWKTLFKENKWYVNKNIKLYFLIMSVTLYILIEQTFDITRFYLGVMSL